MSLVFVITKENEQMKRTILHLILAGEIERIRINEIPCK